MTALPLEAASRVISGKLSVDDPYRPVAIAKMMNKFRTTIPQLIALTIIGSAMAQEIAWPDLPKDGYLIGRAATTEDVDSGIAVFALQLDGQFIGEAVDIPIPQYAVHVDAETGDEEAVVVIQAETNGEIIAIGYKRVSDGEFGVGLIDEFRFLGRDKP